MDAERWRDPALLSEIHHWIDAQLRRLGLERTGESEQSHVTTWSTVIRVPTTAGPVWFKANTESLRHEAVLVDLVSARRPDAVPPPLATDVDRGWLLMADAGERMRFVLPRQQSLDPWLDALRLYATVQLDLVPDVEELLELGVPDLRLEALPDRYDALMDEIDAEPRFRAASTRVRELCDELAAYGIDETLQHDDLHDGQIFVREGRLLLMDWGDSCISHPFFTLSVSLEGNIAWGLDDVEGSIDVGPFRDAYLAPFAERYEGDLVRAVGLALRLGWACRAVNGHVPGDNDHTETRLRMFLDGRAG